MAGKNKAGRACECGLWAVVVSTPEEMAAVPAAKAKRFLSGTVHGGSMARLATDCEEITHSTFSPGHDATLKGLMQVAHRGGMTMVYQAEGGDLVEMTAASAAAKFGFIEHVLAPAPVRAPKAKKAKAVPAGLAAALDKANELAEIEQAAVVEQAIRALVRVGGLEAEYADWDTEGTAPKAAGVPVRIKVGRWEYEGLLGEDDVVEYKDKTGAAKRVALAAAKIVTG